MQSLNYYTDSIFWFFNPHSIGTTCLVPFPNAIEITEYHFIALFGSIYYSIRHYHRLCVTMQINATERRKEDEESLEEDEIEEIYLHIFPENIVSLICEFIHGTDSEIYQNFFLDNDNESSLSPDAINGILDDTPLGILPYIEIERPLLPIDVSEPINNETPQERQNLLSPIAGVSDQVQEGFEQNFEAWRNRPSLISEFSIGYSDDGSSEQDPLIVPNLEEAFIAHDNGFVSMRGQVPRIGNNSFRP